MPRFTTARAAAILASGLALSALLLAAPRAGAIEAGDKVELQFKDQISGKTLSLADYKGKMLVVDFWATWCGPCMAQAGHMVHINTQYAPKGLQIIGVSLDNNAAKMKEVAAAKGFSWPQACDSQGWASPFAKAWGVDSIPRTFLISPEGTVLWTGHPAAIDKELEKAFKEHPPVAADPKGR